MNRRVLGNLDAEEDLATLPDPWGPPDRPARRRQAPSRPALERMAAAATLLRAFAEDGDRLWTPAPPESPLDAKRLAPVPGLAMPILEDGPMDRLEPAAALLAWAQTPVAEAERCKLGETPGTSREVPGTALHGTALHDLLWSLSAVSSELVARVHHRFFALEIAGELGVVLPGARRIESVGELAEHLALAGGAEGWVVKAPLSAAGRSRHIEPSGSGELSAAARQRVARLLARHGPLLFEPWMERVADYGVSLLLLPDEVRLVGFHRLLVDAVGKFQGIELPVPALGIELPATERVRLERTIEGVATALRSAGYLGPFGIDAWRYRRPDGSLAFHPLGEINARMTFGLVARALVDRLEIAMPGTVRLLFGPRVPVAGIPLLLPGSGGAAWLEF